MMTAVAPALVVGGGPSGLVAALTLLQNDVPVRIIDKEPRYNVGQRGSWIWPRTFEVFHLLRIHEACQRATPVLPIRAYKAGTLEPMKTFSMYPYNDPTPSIPYNNPKQLGQSTLEGILRSHLEKHGIFVELGTELQSFEDNPSGEYVFARLVKRKHGEEVCETLAASYIIGADGAKGVTRKQLGLSFLGETRQDGASVVGDICIEIAGVDRNHWHFFGNQPNLFVLRPTDEIGPDGFQFMMTSKEREPKELIADQDLMFKCMSEFIGREINIRKVIFASEFRPNIRMVDNFGRGRVFLVGDAAHVHSLTGGQGLNTCVQDAFNLAWKVSLVYKGISSVALLDSYTSERLPVIAEMLDLTTGILNKLTRDSQAMESAMVREKRMNMLGVNYRTSPIVVDEISRAEPVNAYGVLEEGVLVAGDRAPDAPGLVVAGDGKKTVTKLFDVFGTAYHTVLVFTPDATLSMGIFEILRKFPGGVIRPVIVLPQDSDTPPVSHADVVVDHKGHAYRAYLAAIGVQKVVIVRPDGVTGAIVHGTKGVERYFEKVFV